MKCFKIFFISMLIVLVLVNVNQAIAQGASYSNDNLPTYGQYVGAGEITYPPTTARVMVHAIHNGRTQAAPPEPGMSATYSVDFSYTLSVSTDDGTTWTTYDVPGALSFSAQYSSGSSDERVFDTEMLALNLAGGSLPADVMLRESPTLASTGTTKIKRVADGSYRISSFFDIFTEISLDGGATWTRSATSSRVSLYNPPAAHLFASDNFPPEGVFASSSGSSTGVFDPTKWNILVSTHLSFSPLPALGASSNETVSINFTKVSFSLDGGVTINDYSATGEMQIRLLHVADLGSDRMFDTEMLQLNISGGTLPPGIMLRESPTRASTGRTSIRTSASGHMISSFFDVFTEISLDGGATWAPASEAVSLDFSSSPPSISAAINNFPPEGMDFTPSSYGTTTFENGVMIRNMELRRFGVGLPMPEGPLGVSSSVSSFFDVFTEVSLDGSTWSPRSNVAPVMFSITRQHDDGTSSFFDTEMLALNLQPFGGGLMIRESPTRASTGRVFPTLMSDGKFQVSSFFDVFTEISLDGGATWSPATAPTHIELTNATANPRPVITSISPSTGPVGTIITITGSGFSTLASENLVTLGDNTPIIKGSTFTELRVVLTQPISPLSGGVFPVSVTVGGLSNLPPGPEFTILPNVVSYLPNISDLQMLDVQTGDLDGDGLDEVMMLGKKDFKGHVTLLKRGGDGSQRVSSVISFPDLDLGTTFTGLLDADCDDDGIVDYVALNVTVPKQTQGATFGEKVLAVFQNDPASRGRLKSYRRVLLQQGRVLLDAELTQLSNDDSLDIVCAYAAGDGMPASLQVIKNIPGGGAAAASYAATGFTIPLGGGDCDDLDIYDMDSDGDLDIVAATGAGIYIFQNNSADFEFVRTQIVDETHPYSGVAIGDLDGDGHPDVVALRSDSGIVNVCFGDPLALGSVKAPRDAASGMATGKRQHKPLMVTDADGDGDLDIICPSGEPNQTASVLLLGGSLPGGAIISARLNMDDCDDQDSDGDGIMDAKLFAVGKFDTDQDCDFAFTSCRSTTISPPVVSSFSPDISPAGALVTIEGDNLQEAFSVQIGDFDATFIRESPTRLRVTVPLAARTFAAPHVLDKITISCPSGVCDAIKSFTVSAVILHPRQRIDQLESRFVLGGDMDGDGKGDIVSLSKHTKTGHVTLMKRSDNGSSSRAMVTSFFDGVDDDCDGLSIGDLDGDGLSDVCVALTSRSTGATNFELLFGDPARPGMFRESPTKIQKKWLPANFRLRTMAPEMEDIDGDGKADIVFAIQGTIEDTLVIITNPLSEAGMVVRKLPGRTSYAAITLEQSVASGSSFFDVFVVGDSLVDRYSWSGGGGGSGGSIQLAARGTVKFFNTSKGFRQLAVGDLDGDGSTDAVVFDTDSSVVTVCLDKGDGTFRVLAPRDPPSGQSTGKRSHLVVTDLDGDGKLDIAIDEPGMHFAPAKAARSISDFTYQKIGWTVLYNRTTPSDTAVSFESKTMAMDDWDTGDNDVAVCDLDGDGVQDIVVAGTSSSVVRPPFIERVSATRQVESVSLNCWGMNFSSVSTVDVCSPCITASSFSVLSDSQLAIILPPRYGDKFLSISNDDGIVSLASPITILSDTLKYRTFTYEQLRDASQEKPKKVPSKKVPNTRQPWYAPNTANLIDKILKDEAGFMQVGQSGRFYPWGKPAPYLRPAKQGDVFKTFNDKKTPFHINPPGGPQPMNYNDKGGIISGLKKSITPKEKNDVLIAELLTLQVNLEASDKGHTTSGLGSLVYTWHGPWGQNVTIDSLVLFGDKIMTNGFFGMITPMPVNPTDYDSLYNAVRRINLAFSSPVLDDTSTDGGWRGSPMKFKWLGAHSPIEYDFLIALSGITPRVRPAAEPEVLPVIYTLNQNYPNPFNPTTMISFGLPEPSIVTLKVYNLLGQELVTLLNHESMEAGVQEIEFNANNFPSGVYFYQIAAQGITNEAENTGGKTFNTTRKMLLVK
jgi:hypothetical protein